MKTFSQVNTAILMLAFISSCGSSGNKKVSTDKKGKPYHKGELQREFMDSLKPFYHGVASGDPDQNSVVLWTKVTPEFVEVIQVEYQVAMDSKFQNIVRQGVAEANRDHDYTVKIIIDKLRPASYYYYRFKALGNFSIVGRTKTLPVNAKEVNLIFASCSNYAWGYFNAYYAMANDTVDAIVHLGDYIYEYGKGTYASKSVPRHHFPENEIITLDDYRQRYSQYRLDPGLMKAHQMHPFITIWDDHELANNAYVEGAQNHQPEEGDWNTRKKAAIQAYYEWLPVRNFNPDRLYRSFEFGNLLKLVMLDNRTAGRTVQVKSSADSNYMNKDRAMLGKEQFQWSVNELSSNHTWKIVGNPVLFGDLKIPGWGNNDYYMDGWDGYPVEKQAFCDSLRKRRVINLMFLTGDYHSSLALSAGKKNQTELSRIWNEFVVPSISSGNYDEDNHMDTVLLEEKKYRALNKNLKYVNLCDHGYVFVSCYPSHSMVEYRYVSTVKEPVWQSKEGPRFGIRAR